MKIIPIVFSFDNNLILPACVCIYSLLKNANEDTFYDIFILHSIDVGLEKDGLRQLKGLFRNFRIQYRTVDDCFDKSYEVRGITTATYYRLLIPEVVPEYDKVIYSDVDVIFQSDLSDLYENTDLEGYYVAGVNSLSHLIPDHDMYYKKMSVDSTKTIYAGNIILNSKALLQDGIIDKFRSHAAKQYRFQDMDVLNIVCAGKIKYLPPSFCLTTYYADLILRKKEELCKIWSEHKMQNVFKEGIIHYNGQKPWKGYCLNFDIWWEYYRKSPFFDDKFYFKFFYHKLNELDQLSLWKRIKILIRFFVYGREK